MKNCFLLFTSLILSFNLTFGQNPKSIGILVGFNHSFLTYEESFDKHLDKKLKIGIILGLNGKISLIQNIDLGFDLTFFQKGDKYSIPSVAGYNDYVTKTLNFISLSPVLNYAFVADSYWPYIVLGLNINFVISGKSDSKDLGNVDMTSDLNKFSYDFILGIGFDIHKYGFSTEVRYYYGLSNIPEKGWIDFKTHTISLLIIKEIKNFD